MRIWIFIKLCLSCLVVAVPLGVLLLNNKSPLEDTGGFLIITIMFFIAASLWIDFKNRKNSNKALWLSLLYVSLWCIYEGYSINVGLSELPSICKGSFFSKTYLYCKLKNYLFSYGANIYAAMPALFVGFGMLIYSIIKLLPTDEISYHGQNLNQRPEKWNLAKMSKGGLYLAFPDVALRVNRYIRGWQNFVTRYQPIVNNWVIYDANASNPAILDLGEP